MGTAGSSPIEARRNFISTAISCAVGLGELGVKNKFANGLLGFVLVLLFWQLGSMALQKPFLPTPAASFAAFSQMLLTGELGQHFIISTARILCSIGLAMVLAVPVGLAMGRVTWLGRLLNPIVYLLYPLPKVVFLPIIVVLMGLGN